MESIEKKLYYHELLMVRNNLSLQKDYPLPEGYKFVFYSGESDKIEWIKIHMQSGELNSLKEAEEIFNDFYGEFINELSKRCFFIENKSGEKVATATLSPSSEYGYNCVVDWLAIKKQYQKNGLARPLISRVIKLAKELNYNSLLLHTQTHTWLAAKLYLDFDFIPFNTDKKSGWEILKTLTNHPKLAEFNCTSESNLYDPLIINVVSSLDKLFKEYSYSVYYKDGRKDVFVLSGSYEYYFTYENNGKTLNLVNKNKLPIEFTN